MKNIGNILLMICTIIVVAVGALMALLIGLVLPDYILDEDYLGGSSPQFQRSAGPKPRFGSNYVEERNKRRNYGKIKDFSWLVSIRAPPYLDAPEKLKFICTGVILSKDTVLTGNDCISPPFDEFDFIRCKVKSMSNYIFYEGYDHVVSRFHSSSSKFNDIYRGFYVLKVVPNFPSAVQFLKLSAKVNDWDVAIQAGWGGNKIHTTDIRMHDTFHYEKWYKTKDGCCQNFEVCSDIKGGYAQRWCTSKAIVTDATEKPIISGRPLVVDNGGSKTIIAMEMQYDLNKKCPSFVDLREKKFLGWLVQLRDGRHRQDESDERDSLQTSYLYKKTEYSFYELEEKHYSYLYKAGYVPRSQPALNATTQLSTDNDTDRKISTDIGNNITRKDVNYENRSDTYTTTKTETNEPETIFETDVKYEHSSDTNTATQTVTHEPETISEYEVNYEHSSDANTATQVVTNEPETISESEVNYDHNSDTNTATQTVTTDASETISETDMTYEHTPDNNSDAETLTNEPETISDTEVNFESEGNTEENKSNADNDTPSQVESGETDTESSENITSTTEDVTDESGISIDM